MIHVDIYTIHYDDQGESLKVSYSGPRRMDDPEVIEQWVVVRGLPYNNAYTLSTEPHEDGLCEVHRPKPEVRKWIPPEERLPS